MHGTALHRDVGRGEVGAPTSQPGIRWTGAPSVSDVPGLPGQAAEADAWSTFRHLGHVLRTALVKPAKNNAANAHASTRKIQPTTLSQAAVALAESVVRSQAARATVVPTGRFRSSPTLTC